MSRAVLLLTGAALLALASANGRCEDNIDFTDQIGLACKEWVGEDCNHADNTKYMGYTAEGIKDLLGNCSAACGECTELPHMVVEETKMVFLTFKLGDMKLTKTQFVESFQEAFAGTGTSPSIDDFLEVEYDVKASQGSFYVVGKPFTLLEHWFNVVDTKHAKNAALKTALGAKSVDVAKFVVTAPVKAMAKTSIKALRSSKVTTKAFSGVMHVGEPPKEDWCFDEETFVDKIGLTCQDWVGYDCTDLSRWTNGELEDGYTEYDVNQVARWCPQACGLCQKAGLFFGGVADLYGYCADSFYRKDFCKRWRGINCAMATEMGYSEYYQASLFDWCPMTCYTCKPGKEKTDVCKDNDAFKDMHDRTCSDWAGVVENGASCGIIMKDYTRHGMLEVLANCHKACRVCFDDMSATPPGSQAVESSIQGYFGKLLIKTSDPIYNMGEQYSTCEDDPSYSYIKMFKCSDFIGKSCTIGSLYLDQRWLMSPAGQGVGPWGNWNWHKKLWEACPVACGLCDPPKRETPADLLEECHDDLYFEEWCQYRYEGMDCKQWNTKYSVAFGKEGIQRMNDTIFDRCPSTCGLCTPPECPAGTYRDRKAHECKQCQPGRFAATARSGLAAVECELAAAGDYVAGVGATTFERCEPGSFSGERGSTECTNCLAGSHSDSFSATECTLCSPGWYQELDNATKCNPCPQGQYQEANSSTSCYTCPMDRTTFWNKASSINQCACPEFTYQQLGMVDVNCTPCVTGMTCPGGHFYMNASVDLTGLLQEGYMSMPEDPWTVYTCHSGKDACPGHRQVIGRPTEYSQVCDDGRTGLRCSMCPDGTYLRFGACEDCGDHAGLDVVGKGLLLFIFQFILTVRAYKKEGHDTTEAWIMGMSFVTFCQVLRLLSRVELEWPEELEGFFKFIDLFSIEGLFDVIAFRGACLVSDKPLVRMLRDAIVPLTPFVNFGLLWVYYKAKKKSLNPAKFKNTLGIIYTGYFVSITAMTLQLFPYQTMPSGQKFVRNIPTVELYSSEWFSLLPISIMCMLAYIVVFGFFVIRAVILAPHLVPRDPDFSMQYNFFLGDVNPSAWWWILICLPYYIGLNLIQAFSGDVFVQVYLSMLLLTAVILIHLSVQPNIYRTVNNVQMTLYIAHLVFLIFATAFFKEDDLATQNSSLHAWIMVSVIGLVLSYTCYNIVSWIYGSIKTTPLGTAARVAFRARDIMTLLAQMPDSQFMGLASKMLEVDRELLDTTTDMLVGVFLKEQPTGSKFKQRVIPGKEFRVWNPGKTAAETFKQVKSKSAHRTFEDNVKIHVRAQKLADDLRSNKCGPVSIMHAIEVIRKAEVRADPNEQTKWRRFRRHCLKVISRKKWLAGLKHVLSVFAGNEFVICMSEDEYVEQVQSKTDLSERQLRDLFKLFDLKDAGKMPVVDFFHLLSAMTPSTKNGLKEDAEDEIWGDEEEEKKPEGAGVFGMLVQYAVDKAEAATGIDIDGSDARAVEEAYAEEERQKQTLKFKENMHIWEKDALAEDHDDSPDSDHSEGMSVCSIPTAMEEARTNQI